MRYIPLLAAALAIAPPLLAQPAPAPAAEEKGEFPTPGDIVAQAGPSEWVAIAPSDLLVMDLSPDARGRARRVLIQLMPAPFSQGWIGNIRTLAAAHWWDGLSINRVQDNYVAQWGDADGDDPAKAKVLPTGLAAVGESQYETLAFDAMDRKFTQFDPWSQPAQSQPDQAGIPVTRDSDQPLTIDEIARELDGRISSLGTNIAKSRLGDSYAPIVGFVGSFPFGESIPLGRDEPTLWPVHCYGMVGVGRGMSPDTGSGAELYTVIGHAPRHLDRNIALVGRVIAGIEHLSSLPRGTGPLGFYESAEERVPITSVRLGTEVADLPSYQYLSTESASFAAYADARANRRDPFFIRPAGGADICNIPVPVRRVPSE